MVEVTSIEIFAHGITVSQAPDADDIYLVQGKDWEGNPFDLYLNDDEAKSLLVQLGYQVYDRDRTP